MLAPRFSHTSISIYLEILLYMSAYLFQRVSNCVIPDTLFIGGTEVCIYFPRYDYRCVSTAQAQYWRASPAVC